jgi:hypothetical protein
MMLYVEIFQSLSHFARTMNRDYGLDIAVWRFAILMRSAASAGAQVTKVNQATQQLPIICICLHIEIKHCPGVKVTKLA